MFCLQNGASFGKSQLLNGATLVNQNKNKMAPNFNLKGSTGTKFFNCEYFPINTLDV